MKEGLRWDVRGSPRVSGENYEGVVREHPIDTNMRLVIEQD